MTGWASRTLPWTELDGIDRDHLWLRPLGLVWGSAAHDAVARGDAAPLAGSSGIAFSAIEAFGLAPDRRRAAVAASRAGGRRRARARCGPHYEPGFPRVRRPRRVRSPGRPRLPPVL